MKNIVYISIVIIFLASCASEKNFVKFHHKDNGTSARYCGEWYPVKEKVTTDTTYVEGETQILPGITEFVTVDCDSAVEAIKGKSKTVYVPVPGKFRVDTFIKKEVHQVENTAKVEYLQDALAKATAKQEATTKRLDEVKSTRNKLWTALSISALLLVVYLYIRAKTALFKK